MYAEYLCVLHISKFERTRKQLLTKIDQNFVFKYYFYIFFQSKKYSRKKIDPPIEKMLDNFDSEKLKLTSKAHKFLNDEKITGQIAHSNFLI